MYVEKNPRAWLPQEPVRHRNKSLGSPRRWLRVILILVGLLEACRLHRLKTDAQERTRTVI